MKSILLAGCLALTATVADAQSHGHSAYRSSYKPVSSQVRVSGYTRSNGTYVQAHRQTAPNRTKADNWSSKPNVNPYTGHAGTKDPYSTGH